MRRRSRESCSIAIEEFLRWFEDWRRKGEPMGDLETMIAAQALGCGGCVGDAWLGVPANERIEERGLGAAARSRFPQRERRSKLV